jgi:hypothetical protein
MSLSPEQRQARARVAINKRHHPDKPELVADDVAELERAANDRAIDDIVRRAPKMTAEQAARVGRIFRYAPPRDPGTAGAG